MGQSVDEKQDDTSIFASEITTPCGTEYKEPCVGDKMRWRSFQKKVLARKLQKQNAQAVTMFEVHYYNYGRVSLLP